MKKALKIFLIIVSCLLGAVVLFLAVLNISKFAIYNEYYKIEDTVCKNPGLNDGFVCQGICVYESAEKFLISGYMSDNSASRVYVTDKNDNSYFVSLTQNGKEFTGHLGGIAVNDGMIYIADGGKIYSVAANAIMSASNADCVEIGSGIDVNNAASFTFADENYLYVGEFHDGGKYVTDHPYETNDGTYYAIVSRYSFDDLTTPNKIYSIRNKVQGFCVTPNGKIVLSTSYGLTDTVYYIYNEDEAVNSGITYNNAPVYFLDNCIQEIKGPAMGEGLDFYDGKVITLTESASDKYIFGKLFFANDIVSLDIK